MKRGDEAADGLDRERQALLEQLRAAEQASRLPAFCQTVEQHRAGDCG
jgi:hypothetical protein